MGTRSLTLETDDYGLLTDLYQLTMSACYVGEGIAETPASFELFLRQLPDSCGYLVAAGLEQALDYLKHLKFTGEQVSALEATGLFAGAPPQFWSLLQAGGFTGDVWAIPEGTVAFAHEPLLRIEAPLWQAQLVETYLLNTLNYQTGIATRAARMRDAAGSKTRLLEFGTRRASSPQGALWAARAALIAGFDATSNVLAALELGQQPSGTMAHSLVMAIAALQGSEDEAFAAFQRYFPSAPLLIDTYDPVAAADRLAARVRAGTLHVAGVRIDSGDLVKLSQSVRERLPEAVVIASGNIDEYEIARLRAAGACIDGYGVGTSLVTGQLCDGVYKLVEINSISTMKTSNRKETYPGRKQIFRHYEGDRATGDRLALMEEVPQPGERALLQRVMRRGQLLQPVEAIAAIRARSVTGIASLPPSARKLDAPEAYPVAISTALEALTHEVRSRPVAAGPQPATSRL
ncbi:putative nicotinate phosphoribosyltransferase [Rubidibacter lacunae KORDI 51-2]|uniref:Nicotinate phosphoribosyltransferase n=1 Tax=Rubidibacter lacunae KORDI 51-2 TaxID=582515 RepID=U5DMB2_9CHRO|nr:nicotinate phosphoribosyltransferase [Rubidibacter lacunae]ERN42816.1 putative nicotinate phosphoribosyltransferase [Rubidibacter lacunae KORDI 51-2]